MKVHEYQAKQVLARYGVPIPKGFAAFSVDDAVAAADKLAAETHDELWVVKAQIHAGGRGKAGGVKIAKSKQAVSDFAKTLLGSTLVTHQTGPHGQKVNRLYIEQGLAIDRELYLAMLTDRDSRKITVIASPKGGMDIEAVANETPDAIRTIVIDPIVGLANYQAQSIGFFLGLGKASLGKFVALLHALYLCYVAEDCSLLEINPLAVLKTGEVVALDAKVTFDDNAEFRHKSWADLLDRSEVDPVELQAHEAGLNYVALDGDIGCLVNGAGLAMATMDMIQLAGGMPANFLDVGGGANEQQVTKAFTMILSSPKVRAIFVNIFGGIMKCDVVANGIVAAAKNLGLRVPLVVRLEGTNVDLGKQILRESGLQIVPANSIADGAQLAVAAAKKTN